MEPAAPVLGMLIRTAASGKDSALSEVLRQERTVPADIDVQKFVDFSVSRQGSSTATIVDSRRDGLNPLPLKPIYLTLGVATLVVVWKDHLPARHSKRNSHAQRF